VPSERSWDLGPSCLGSGYGEAGRKMESTGAAVLFKEAEEEAEAIVLGKGWK